MPLDVIPANAGIQSVRHPWTPAFAGMTLTWVIPTKVGIQSVRHSGCRRSPV